MADVEREFSEVCRSVFLLDPSLPVQLIQIGHGFHNMNYRIVCGDKTKGILRIFLSKQLTSGCSVETVSLRFLNGADAPRIFSSHADFEGKRASFSNNFIIEEFVEGQTLSNEISGFGVSESQLIECGKLLSKLHSHNVSPLEGSIVDQSKEAPIILLPAAYQTLGTDFAAKTFPNVIQILRDSEKSIFALQSLILENPELYLGNIVLVHGDVCFDNFYRRKSDQKLIQLDWEFAHLGYGLEDIASLVNENKLTDEQQEILLKSYYEPNPITDTTRKAFWAWKLRRSFGLFTIVIDRLRLMEEGISSELDNKQIYTDVVNAEVEYVKKLLANRP